MSDYLKVFFFNSNLHLLFSLTILCFRATDEVFQALEDNQVTLSTMKASRFVKAFEKEVDYWERTLSHILEVIEVTLTVQRQWMYLEVYHLYHPYTSFVKSIHLSVSLFACLSVCLLDVAEYDGDEFDNDYEEWMMMNNVDVVIQV